MKFKSKPHEIEAFQFKGNESEYPNWFLELYRVGGVFITITNKNQYIEIITKRGSLKAFMGEWICKNSSNNLFVLSEEELKNGFYECC